MKPSVPAPLVLDTWALLAYLQAEPAGPVVRGALEAARQDGRRVLLSGMSVGELCYIVERRLGTVAVQDLLSGLEDLGLGIVYPDRATILAAAHVKAHFPISFGDAFVVSLAQAEGATVMAGDPDFRKIGRLVPIDWLDT